VVYFEQRNVFSHARVLTTGYIYVNGLPPLSEMDNPLQRTVVFEEEPHYCESEGYRTVVLCADGHVAGVPGTPADVVKEVIREFGNVPVSFELVRKNHSEPVVEIPDY